MIEWIETNKTILFSGLGTAILIFVLGKVFSSSKKGRTQTQTQKSGNNSTNVQIGDVHNHNNSDG